MLIFSFFGLLLISFGAVALSLMRSSRGGVIHDRIKAIRKTLSDDGNAELLRRRTDQKSLLSDSIGVRIAGSYFSKSLATLLLHAGSKASVGSVILTSGCIAVGSALTAHLLFGKTSLILAAIVLGGTLRYLTLRFQKSRRLEQFNHALPDALELMARALRAGHSLASSIEIIAEQSAQPVGAEFESCFKQQKFGIPLRDALLEMGDRVPSKDLHFFITAVLVQKETGGDLTEILDRTTLVIRDRVRIEAEVRTYTAQGRLTGWILALLPVFLLGAISVVSPGYASILFSDPLGLKLLYAGGTLIMIGGLIIRKIVNIQV